MSQLTDGAEFTRSTENDSVLTGGAEHKAISQASVLIGEAEHSQPTQANVLTGEAELSQPTQASVLTGDAEPTLPTQESVLSGDAEPQPELSEGLDGQTGETVTSHAGTSPLQLTLYRPRLHDVIHVHSFVNHFFPFMIRLWLLTFEQML